MARYTFKTRASRSDACERADASIQPGWSTRAKEGVRGPLPVRAACLLATLAALAAQASQAYETDPYANRHLDVADSLDVLDAKVNDALDEIAASWNKGEDEWAFVMAMYRKVGGVHWVDKLERWAMEAPEVAKVPVTRAESLVADFPLLAGRVAAIFGFGPTINVGGVYFGTDKIGHFFSQGRKFYGRYRSMGDEAKAARRSVLTEKGLFGRLTTGVYSNADLVANYEGHRFYRSLFHDGVVAGKAAIFRWRKGVPIKQRAFTWADHVNSFWDEALNANVYSPRLLPYVERRMLLLCDDFRRRPERYRVADADALFQRYRQVGLVDTSALRPETFLGENCAAPEGVASLSRADKRR